MKFRIWDRLEKKMIYPDSPGAHHFIINLKGEVYNLHNGSGGDDYIVMPLYKTDSKLGDIYQGDILKVENFNEWWDTEMPTEEDRYHYLVISDIRYDYACSIKNTIEKSGNVFENPEIVVRS